MNNVSFGYNETKTIIRNLTLEIEGGNWVTVVGESGAGKSTLINLIVHYSIYLVQIA